MSSDDTTRVIRPKQKISTDSFTETAYINETSPAREIKDEETKIFRPKSSGGSEGASSRPSDYHMDPVVGWLVVLAGAGKGVSIALGYGVNSIGRDVEQRVSLDFGDEEISRRSHASVIYDQKSRKFYVQHGEGINLTYVNDEPVLQPRELFGREEISIGNTRLVFIPLCGPDFEWAQGG